MYSNNNKCSTPSSYQSSLYITEFNKKGIIEYFERVDAAKKRKIEKEEIKNKITG